MNTSPKLWFNQTCRTCHHPWNLLLLPLAQRQQPLRQLQPQQQQELLQQMQKGRPRKPCDISDASIYGNDQCGDRKFPVSNFQFGDNVDFHNSAITAPSVVISTMAFSLALLLLMI